MSVNEREVGLGEVMSYIDLSARLDVLTKLLNILNPVANKILDKSVTELPEGSELADLITELVTDLVLVERGVEESVEEANEIDLPSAQDLIEAFAESDSSIIIGMVNDDDDEPEVPKEGKLINMFDYTNKGEQ